MQDNKIIYEYSLIGVNQQIEKNKKQVEILNFYVNCGLNTKEEIESQIQELEKSLDDLLKLKDTVENLLK